MNTTRRRAGKLRAATINQRRADPNLLEVFRLHNASRAYYDAGKVTVILLQSSPSNDYLSARAAEDELTGIAYGEISLKNLNGATIVAGGSDAWIRKPAQIEYGAEVSNREWVFQVADLDLNVAGEVR